MRIWSLHPAYLDRQGLVACWRETLLAQAVLAGRTRGYLNHPQLERFRAAPEPLRVVGAYLSAIATEADARGYRFDRARVDHPDATGSGDIAVTTGQLALEWSHLSGKLRTRDPERLALWTQVTVPEPHPLFRVVEGPVASWERASPSP
ncbi:pyrimidine dimer DNA glycosylase/endonuclease V [Microbacterium sp. SD291]|uniref:pyrimidine dimer DNA glycosylase/endonuclease V n=1 Tax=Microbacterium sp. SD291 TaxID=2782007 RepID=UPI001A95ACFC|nr:pyrimidine dimer DNA glycosylase/endonuclease V [Microbacterium sp. SD291]MBO0979425.1 pyrimidine dimer DNA glycosylase [Microbacterium sp. SD291]